MSAITRSRASVISLLALIALVLAAAAQAGYQPPPGAVKLKPNEIKRVDGFTCGRPKRGWQGYDSEIWLPGEKLRQGYFLTHTAKLETLAKQARRADGARKQRLKKKAKKLKQLNADGKDACNVDTARRFKLAGAAGLALAQRAEEESRSNLDVVEEDGEVREALKSGSATIDGIEIAGNGKVYVLFRQPTDLGRGFTCLFAEVDPDTGTPTCVDREIGDVAWKWMAGLNPPVQLDSSGAVYYLGLTPRDGTVLRRYRNGATVDLIDGKMDDFLVLPDESVLITPSKPSSTRRVAPNGSVTTVSDDPSSFMRLFPDGHIYLGNRGRGVQRFLLPANQLETKYWLTGTFAGWQPEPPYHDVAPFCGLWESPPGLEGFCGYVGSRISQSVELPGDRVFVVQAGSGTPVPGALVQYYPTVAVPTTGLSSVTDAEAAGSKVVASGLTPAGRNRTVLYDPATDGTTELIGEANEIKVSHLNYVASANNVMFDGLRFADNRYVIGEIDLSTGAVSYPTTAGTKWTDFQTFE